VARRAGENPLQIKRVKEELIFILKLGFQCH
jgi:hypothetical protein